MAGSGLLMLEAELIRELMQSGAQNPPLCLNLSHRQNDHAEGRFS